MGKNPTIYYYCYDHNLPSGGQKHTYRHVDILNKNGFDAKVLHTAKNFRLTWFDNTTPVVSYQECVAKMNERRDFLVLPEDLGPRILDFPGRKVIFNKNIFHGFSAFGYEMRATYPTMTEVSLPPSPYPITTRSIWNLLTRACRFIE